MSWLYTILFTGLVLSSQEGSANKSQAAPFVDNTAVHATVGDETEKFEQTYPLNANGRVNVSNVNGSVVVEAWDRNEVKFSYTKVADSKDRLADVEVKIDSRADFFSVEADYNNWKKDKGSDTWRSGRLNVEIRMRVPRGAVLNEIETVNGSVSVSNFTNITRVSAVNGSVTATNLRGTAKLSTVNGEVAADFDRLEAGTKISLDTVNGKVNLVIPSDSNATLKADSLNGTITNDFGLPVRKGKYIGRDLYGKLGSGEVQIKLDSVNGNLSVARKADGKSLSPTVNLLPQKEKDDDNWDKNGDNDSMKSSKLDKDIAKAVKESQKASVKAVVDAEAAISKIQPEIAKITADSIARSAEAITRSAEILNSREVQRELERAQIVQRNAITRMEDIGFSGIGQRVEKKSGVFVMKGVPKVTVKADGCSVNVRGWDRSEVQYRVTQFADSRNRTPLNIRENHTDSTVDIVVENADDRGGNRSFVSGAARVRVEVYVPRKANLKINADGELRVEGVTGDVELTGSDEPINVRDVDGKLRVTNSDGLVRVIGFSGEVESKTDDGEVYLEGQFSRITGSANDGSYFLTVPENPNADIKANIEALTIENLRIPTSVAEGHWRFGAGGPKYTFTVADGCVTVRNATSLTQ